MINQILECLISGIRTGFYACLKVLPFYEQLNNLKEQLFAWALGIPVAIVSLVFLVPKIVKTVKEIIA